MAHSIIDLIYADVFISFLYPKTEKVNDVLLLLCFSLAAWTLITQKCVATKAMYWTSSGIPSLKTS